jgi:hypothetical protein
MTNVTVFRAATTMNSNDFKMFLDTRKQSREASNDSITSHTNKDDYYNSLDIYDKVMYTNQDYNINYGSTLYDILRDNPFKTDDYEDFPNSFYDSNEYIRMIEAENDVSDDYDSENDHENDCKSSSESEDDEWVHN